MASTSSLVATIKVLLGGFSLTKMRGLPFIIRPWNKVENTYLASPRG